jgi:hypothetical protein
MQGDASVLGMKYWLMEGDRSWGEIVVVDDSRLIREPLSGVLKGNPTLPVTPMSPWRLA